VKGKIFNAQEVQALISGNKTQFREIAKINFKSGINQNFTGLKVFKFGDEFRISGSTDEVCKPFKCPYQVGQKIFAKESFWQFGCYDNGIDGDEPRFIESNKITFCPEEAAKPQTLCKGWKKRPAQHMKQEHSRLTLQIKEIRVERLSEISVIDARDEGCPLEEALYKKEDFDNVQAHQSETHPFIKNFKRFWNATHKKPEEKFEASPWVWVVNFEVVK